MPKSTDLKKIRSQIRDARRSVPKHYARQASYRFSEQVAELDVYKNASTVAGFVPFDGEADPLPLMDRAILDGKTVYVPIIIARAEPLKFAPWSRAIETRSNRFGIAEPIHSAEELIQGEDLDCVIAPLVAFDESCHRVGVGGGFYDRTFSFLNASADTNQPRLVGIAYEMQKLDKLKPKNHDVPLDFVVTELAVYEKA